MAESHTLSFTAEQVAQKVTYSMLSAYVHCRTGSFMGLKTIPFDIVAELDSEAARHEYLAQVLVDGDGEEILRALGHVAQALDRAPLNINNGVEPRPLPSQG